MYKIYMCFLRLYIYLWRIKRRIGKREKNITTKVGELSYYSVSCFFLVSVKVLKSEISLCSVPSK